MKKIEKHYDLQRWLGYREASNAFGYFRCRIGTLALNDAGEPVGFATDEPSKIKVMLDDGTEVKRQAPSTEDLRRSYEGHRFISGACSREGIFTPDRTEPA